MLTSNFSLSAKIIADIYKKRWQVEIFFRLIKQTLKVKSVIGKSKNAVLSQIYVAMIAHLLLAYLKFSSKIGRGLQQMVQLVQLNIFRRFNFEELFDQPTKTFTINEGCPLLEMAC